MSYLTPEHVKLDRTARAKALGDDIGFMFIAESLAMDLVDLQKRRDMPDEEILKRMSELDLPALLAQAREDLA